MNLLTVIISRDAGLNLAVQGLLLFLPGYILLFFPTKEVDSEKCIGRLANETPEDMLHTTKHANAYSHSRYERFAALCYNRRTQEGLLFL